MKQIKVYYNKSFYTFTIDEKDEKMFMHAFNVSNYPSHLIRTLDYYNVNYTLKTEVIQWVKMIILFYQFIAKTVNF